MEELVTRLTFIAVLTVVFVVWSYIDTVIILEIAGGKPVMDVLTHPWAGVLFVLVTTVPMWLAYAVMFEMVESKIWVVGLAIGMIGQIADYIGTYIGSHTLPSPQELLALGVMGAALLIAGIK